MDSLNKQLRGRIQVLRAEPVSDDFHARYSAIWREYRYLVLEDDAAGARTRPCLVLVRHRAARPRGHEPSGAKDILGTHDFRAFCRRPTNASRRAAVARGPGRALGAARRRVGDEPRHAPAVRLTIRAQSFCHNMVRCLVSTMVAIGQGDWTTRQSKSVWRAWFVIICRPPRPPADSRSSAWVTAALTLVFRLRLARRGREDHGLGRLPAVKKDSQSSGFAAIEFSREDPSSGRPLPSRERVVDGNTHRIPSDRSSYGTFDILHENSERAIRAILQEAQNADEGEVRKFGDLYTSFLDEDRVEALGATPLRELLNRVEAIDSVDQLLRTLGELQHAGLSGLYEVFIDSDPGNPERYVAFFEQGGISLPDESYYREEHFAEERDAYVAHVKRMFELAGFQESQARASRVMELETQIAKRHWDNVATRDMDKTYNLVTWEEAKALLASGLPSGDETSTDLDVWREGFSAPDGALDEVVLREPSFVHDVAQLLETTELESWKDWLAWRVIRGYAPYLSKAFTEELFDFYGRTLTGALEQRERWKRGVSFVEGAMGEAVGKVYVERHFPPDAKQQMDVLVANLVEAYRQSISHLEWMSPATRERALGEARRLHAQDRLPRRVARLFVDRSRSNESREQRSRGQ